MEDWKDHLRTKMGRPSLEKKGNSTGERSTSRNSLLHLTLQKFSQLTCPFQLTAKKLNMGRIKKATMKLKNGKEAGADNIPGEH